MMPPQPDNKYLVILDLDQTLFNKRTYDFGFRCIPRIFLQVLKSMNIPIAIITNGRNFYPFIKKQLNKYYDKVEDENIFQGRFVSLDYYKNKSFFAKYRYGEPYKYGSNNFSFYENYFESKISHEKLLDGCFYNFEGEIIVVIDGQISKRPNRYCDSYKKYEVGRIKGAGGQYYVHDEDKMMRINHLKQKYEKIILFDDGCDVIENNKADNIYGVHVSTIGAMNASTQKLFDEQNELIYGNVSCITLFDFIATETDLEEGRSTQMQNIANEMRIFDKENIIEKMKINDLTSNDEDVIGRLQEIDSEIDKKLDKHVHTKEIKKYLTDYIKRKFEIE